MRSKSSTLRVPISFEWFREGQWAIHTPLIPERAVSQALRDLKSQFDTVRNVRIAGAPR